MEICLQELSCYFLEFSISVIVVLISFSSNSTGADVFCQFNSFTQVQSVVSYCYAAETLKYLDVEVIPRRTISAGIPAILAHHGPKELLICPTGITLYRNTTSLPPCPFSPLVCDRSA